MQSENNKTMENKQTAVEWLEQKMLSDTIFSWKVVFEKAKQMEKEQIIDAFEEGWDGNIQEAHRNATYGKGYYNETYGN